MLMADVWLMYAPSVPIHEELLCLFICEHVLSKHNMRQWEIVQVGHQKTLLLQMYAQASLNCQESGVDLHCGCQAGAKFRPNGQFFIFKLMHAC